ncbi:MAG: divalent-cation tolerance protein CutA [Deltaproteobacteria bacterium]|nr:divalent-cation tolerance protein CutA [Deltaproteobacteria bacterium]
MKPMVIFVTVPSKKVGQEIATLLLKERLAACVQILPGLESHYLWQKKICCDAECLLLIKSQKSRFQKLKKIILANHPYQIPQVVAIPITMGHAKYLQWMKTEMKSSSIQ